MRLFPQWLSGQERPVWNASCVLAFTVIPPGESASLTASVQTARLKYFTGVQSSFDLYLLWSFFFFNLVCKTIKQSLPTTHHHSWCWNCPQMILFTLLSFSSPAVYCTICWSDRKSTMRHYCCRVPIHSNRPIFVFLGFFCCEFRVGVKVKMVVFLKDYHGWKMFKMCFVHG